MRRECRKRGIERLKVVCSSEKALEPREKIMNGEKQVPGSIAFVPSVAGLVLASEIIKDIINGN
jgi:tRNA A37 threonylcarbamoyladenosine dehydratase